MVIKSVKEMSYSGMIKVAAEEGAAFYVRREYLPTVDFDLIQPGACFDGPDEDEILDAGLSSVVEFKAVSYLGRAEQSRFGLSRKLRNKGYEQKYIDMALDYLEAKNYLSDTRFANAWVVDRLIGHYEGKSRLKAELSSKGVSREIADSVVEDVFEEFDEMEICKKAYMRFIKMGKTDNKLMTAMFRSGFSMRQVKELKEILENER